MEMLDIVLAREAEWIALILKLISLLLVMHFIEILMRLVFNRK